MSVGICNFFSPSGTYSSTGYEEYVLKNPKKETPEVSEKMSLQKPASFSEEQTLKFQMVGTPKVLSSKELVPYSEEWALTARKVNIQRLVEGTAGLPEKMSPEEAEKMLDFFW